MKKLTTNHPTKHQRRDIYEYLIERYSQYISMGMCIDLGDLLPKGYLKTDLDIIHDAFPEVFIFAPLRVHSDQIAIFWYDGLSDIMLYRQTLLMFALAELNSKS